MTMDVSADIEQRRWHDRLAIQELVYRYSDAVTRADWPHCESVYAENASWECPAMGLRFDARAAFMESLLTTIEYQLLIQTPHAPVITFTGPERARVTTTIHEMVKSETVSVGQYGIYFDGVARIDGAWKFTRRRFEPIYVAHNAVTGDVPKRRSELLRTD